MIQVTSESQNFKICSKLMEQTQVVFFQGLS